MASEAKYYDFSSPSLLYLTYSMKVFEREIIKKAVKEKEDIKNRTLCKFFAGLSWISVRRLNRSQEFTNWLTIR